MIVQRAALCLSQGFVISFLESSTGRWAMLQLLCSQSREKLRGELLEKKKKQNLRDRPSTAVYVCIQIPWHCYAFGKILTLSQTLNMRGYKS